MFLLRQPRQLYGLPGRVVEPHETLAVGAREKVGMGTRSPYAVGVGLAGSRSSTNPGRNLRGLTFGRSQNDDEICRTLDEEGLSRPPHMP
jgi:hypothetical protein